MIKQIYIIKSIHQFIIQIDLIIAYNTDIKSKRDYLLTQVKCGIIKILKIPKNFQKFKKIKKNFFQKFLSKI